MTLRRHFQPLLDPSFDEFLRGHYPSGVAIEVDGRRLDKQRWSAPRAAPLEIRLARKRKAAASGYLIRADHPLPEERQGLSISTYGKVIRRGWDWLGLTPAAADCVGGIIEVPELAACLTLNKGDFIRSSARGATYLGFRKAIQEAVGRQLALWGDGRSGAEQAPPREVRPLQRDLVQVLEDLGAGLPPARLPGRAQSRRTKTIAAGHTRRRQRWPWFRRGITHRGGGERTDREPASHRGGFNRFKPGHWVSSGA